MVCPRDVTGRGGRRFRVSSGAACCAQRVPDAVAPRARCDWPPLDLLGHADRGRACGAEPVPQRRPHPAVDLDGRHDVDLETKGVSDEQPMGLPSGGLRGADDRCLSTVPARPRWREPGHNRSPAEHCCGLTTLGDTDGIQAAQQVRWLRRDRNSIGVIWAVLVSACSLSTACRKSCQHYCHHRSVGRSV